MIDAAKIEKSYLCPVLKRFISEITNSQLCNKGDKILLAVSGGIDSIVMAHLFLHAKYTVGIAHCNFQLRGDDSNMDEEFVKAFSGQFKLSFHTKQFETNNYAVDNGFSVQMAARELRYAWFKELMDEHGYNTLATAHHLNDNIETTLLNLIRGTGLSGLTGIPFKSNRIIRPLLNFTKCDLIAYAKENGVAWREDSSNESAEYDRNFIRHEVMPQLKKLNPSLEKTFDRTHQRLLAAEALFQLGLEGIKQKFVFSEKGRTKINNAFLITTQFPVGVAWELVKEYGFNYAQCSEMVKVPLGSSGKKFLSPTHQLVIDREAWIIEGHNEKITQVLLYEEGKEISFGGLQMIVERGLYPSLSADPMVAMFNAEKVRFPLICRSWENGDSFYPLGMENQKKLSDFFTDKKLSLLDKQRASVVESDGDIIWVVGHRIDNRFKVTDQKKQIIRLTVNQIYD